MQQSNCHFVKILNIRQTEDISYHSLHKDIYKNFFLDIDKVKEIKFWKTRHIKLSGDLIATSKLFVSSLKKTKDKKTIIIILEALEEKKDYRFFDDICTCLINALTERNFPKPWCLVIVTPNIEALQEGVILTYKLVDLCNNKQIALIILSNEQQVEPKILCWGKLPSGWIAPSINIKKDVDDKCKEQNDLATIQLEIKENFDSLFGHFEIERSSKTYHVSSIASVEKLVRNEKIVDHLFNEVLNLVQNDNITIHPVGLPLGGINELAIALSQKDTDKVCLLNDHTTKKDCSVIILCDFLTNAYSINNIVEKHKNNGIKDFGILGIAKYKDFIDIDGVQSKYFLDSEYTSSDVIEKEKCQFCLEDVPIIKGGNLKDFERAVMDYDSYTFWEFIRQNKDFINLGHWPSDRTINHYHFRIITKPIFLYHGYDLSLRIKNLLFSNKLLHHWIKKIVCTEGEESGILSKNIAQVIGLKESDIIKIPRKYFKYIAGKDIHKSIIEYINEKIGENNLKEKNVIIVDQAAHHFGTLVSLKTVCEYYNCSIFAFIVFIDRTGTEFSLGEYLYDTHYISLYSWPSPPRTQNQCPCKIER